METQTMLIVRQLSTAKTHVNATYSFEDVVMGLGMIGTDPEILHGRWLMGWLPIVKLKLYWYTRGWLIDNDGRLQHYITYIELELYRAHTLRAHCAIYRVAFVCMAIIL